MKKDIVVPSVGESVLKGTLVTWLKNTGESIQEGDAIFEFETDKATVTVSSTATGVLTTHVAAGTEATIGQKVASVEEGAQSFTQAKPSVSAPVAQHNQILSPAVRRIVTENKLDTSKIRGTGKDGRITKEDTQSALPPLTLSPPSHPTIYPANAPAPTIADPVVSPTTRGQTRVPMTTIRRRTSERLIMAQQQSACVTTFNEFDMSKVIAIRSQWKDAFEKEHNIRLGFLSFFVKACSQSLKVFPIMNAQIDKSDIIYNNDIHMGVAVSTATGLFVPVIRNADQRSFANIETTIASLAQRAQTKKLMPDELTGGTFTITNGGIFGSLLSTPIPAFPQVAIIGLHAIQKRAVVVDDAIVIRPMMYVAVTYDHRLIDGKEAIEFLGKIKKFIENPDLLFLET